MCRWYDEENKDDLYFMDTDLADFEEEWDPTLIGYKTKHTQQLWESDFPFERPTYKEIGIFDKQNKRKNRKDRYETHSSQMSRSEKLSKQLKQLYFNTCQVCRTRVDIGSGEFYSETHHIQPRAEGGPDVQENMIVLCSNCHKMFDLRAITIDLVKRTVHHVNPHHPLNGRKLILNHYIAQKYVDYHNLKMSKETQNVG
jgi:predicted restriction endonuclease